MSRDQTERALSSAFLAAMSGPGAGHYGDLADLAAELRCRQGVPDFVGRTSIPNSRLGPLQAEVLATPSAAQVLALLKPRASRREDYLLAATGLSRPVMHRALSSLQSAGLARPLGSGFAMAEDPSTLRVQLWAFELKLQQWRRALYQALTYQLFADRVVVVLSAAAAHRVEPHLHRFRRWGIGVTIFDPEARRMTDLLRPLVSDRKSRYHYYYALGQYLRVSGIASQRALR